MSTSKTTADWERYLAPGGHALFRDEQLRLDDGRLLGAALEPWQREKILDPIDARDEHDRPYNKLVDLELARGHAKTTLAAAVVDERLVLGGHDQRFFAIASDEDQAALLLEAAAGFIGRNPALAKVFTIERRTIRCIPTGNELRVMSGDAPSAYGLLPDLILVDEIAQFRNRELWDSMYSAAVKRPGSQVIVTSTPGWSRSSIAWEVREAARQQPGYYLFAPGVRLATWLDTAELERQRKTLPAHVYKRLHEGVWSEGEGAFLTVEDLARCVRAELRPVARCTDGAHALGIDLGLSKDRTAAAIVHRTDDGVRLEHLCVWQGTLAAPVSITGEVEPHMLDCLANFSQLYIVLDRWNARSTFERFAQFSNVGEFTFSEGRIDQLTRNLYALAHGGQLELYPDAELERELLDVQIVEKSYGVRIDHRAGKHDDRVIALGMAAHAAMQFVRVPAFDELEWQRRETISPY